MGKASIDDCLTDHPKFLDLGPQVGPAGWLWLAGLLYARRTLTDGFIPHAKVSTLVPGQKGPYSLASSLVTVGLWIQEPNGFRIHDFHDHNPTKAQVQKYQEQDRLRKQAKRSGQPAGFRPDSESESIQHGSRVRGRDAKSESESESASESVFASEALPEESARETAPPEPARQPPVTLDARHRLCPAFTWAACMRGICVPRPLHGEWMRQLGSDSVNWDASERRIGALVDKAIAALKPGPVGAMPYDFWRAVWRAEHDSQAPAKPADGAVAETKNQRTIAALARAGARLTGGAQ